MRIVRHQSFLEAVCDITPNVAWLSVIVPQILREAGSKKAGLVENICEDLVLKINSLTGAVLDLDTQTVEVETNDVFIVDNDQIQIIKSPSVIILAKSNNLEELKAVEANLRAALAEAIVDLAEAQGIQPEEVLGGTIDDTTKEMFADPKFNCKGCDTSRAETNASVPCSCPK